MQKFYLSFVDFFHCGKFEQKILKQFSGFCLKFSIKCIKNAKLFFLQFRNFSLLIFLTLCRCVCSFILYFSFHIFTKRKRKIVKSSGQRMENCFTLISPHNYFDEDELDVFVFFALSLASTFFFAPRDRWWWWLESTPNHRYQMVKEDGKIYINFLSLFFLCKGSREFRGKIVFSFRLMLSGTGWLDVVV